MAGKRAIPGIPFGSAVGDGVDLMRKVWGMAGLPSIPSPGNLAQMAVRLPTQLPNMVAPTFDIEELDKRIAEMHAVEHWLQLNLSMLRATIQSLEVQRSTIATLKGIGGAVLSPVLKGKDGGAAPAQPAAMPDPMAAFAQQMALLQAMQAMPLAQPAPTLHAPPAEVPSPDAEEEPEAEAEPESEPPARRARRKPKAAAPRVQVPVPSTLNPVVWWNAVQDQFARIAATAAEAEPSATPAAAATKRARKAAGSSGKARKAAKRASPARKRKAAA
jgi:hypothetical protein